MCVSGLCTRWISGITLFLSDAEFFALCRVFISFEKFSTTFFSSTRRVEIRIHSFLLALLYFRVAVKQFALFALPLFVLFCMLISGCSTAADRIVVAIVERIIFRNPEYLAFIQPCSEFFVCVARNLFEYLITEILRPIFSSCIFYSYATICDVQIKKIIMPLDRVASLTDIGSLNPLVVNNESPIYDSRYYD